MDFNKLTIKSQEAVAAAQELARRRGNPELTPEHLLLALLDQELFADWQRAARRRRAEASPRCRPCRAASSSRTSRPRSRACSTGGRRAATARGRLHLDRASVPRARARAARARSSPGSRRCAAASASPRRIPRARYQALAKFGRDLTEAAEAGKLDPVIGRDEEIRRVIQILSRRTKNNPVLIGEPGVGKTAIAEGLAQRIVAGDVPEGLKDRRVWVARHRRAARRREVPRRVRGAAEGGARRDQELATAGSSSSSTSCTRSSAPARPRAPSTRRTC